MADKKRLLGICVLLLVFGITIVERIQAQTDNRLNGIWFIVEEEGIEREMRFTSGNFEDFIDDIPAQRGTYTVNNNNLTLNFTHIYGTSFNNVLNLARFESKWYTINEMVQVIRPIFFEFGLSERQVNDAIYELLTGFVNVTLTYSVDASTLILTNPNDRSVLIYTKR